MNKLYFLILSVVFMQACSTPKQAAKIEFSRTGEVKCTQYDRDVIQLLATSQASSLEEASIFAERNAFENLLFKGIPNSNQETPLVANESESMRQHADFYRNFILNRDYEKFVTESFISYKEEKKGVWLVRQQMEVDLEATRRHLEQNNIIRKFGL